MSLQRIATLAAGMAICAALAHADGINYTCDPTVATYDGSGVCAYLQSTVAALYSSTFTNANANIYITTTASGLGGSFNYTEEVPYSTYRTALFGESTDTAAKASLPSSEPSIFPSTSDVGITAALASALNITGSQTYAQHIYGVEPLSSGTDPSVSACMLGDSGCYNGVIEIVIPADLQTAHSQGLWFRNVAGTASGAQPSNDYDYFSVVEHETDEILGTSSCTDVQSGPTAVDNCIAGGGPSAVDLFRYSASGTRVFNSLTPTKQYFSPNGGVTDTDNATYNTTKAGEDYADFSQSCAFVQDAEGCPGKSLDITNDYQGGPGPEVQILNAVGYDLVSTPEPGTIALLGGGLALLGLRRRRRA
jgi:hypothetical protein